MEGNRAGIHRRLLRFLTPYRTRFALALLAMVGYGATDGAIPLLIRRVLDDIFGANNREMLFYLPILIVAFAVVRGALNFFQNYLAASVGHSIIRDIRNEIHKKLLTLSPSFFEKETSGALLSRMTNDTLLVRFAVTDAVATVLKESVRVIAVLSAAMYLDPVLGCIAFVGFPLGLLPIIKLGRKIRRLSRVGQDQLGGLTGLLQETVIGHRVVQSFGNENHECERFGAENQRFTSTLLRAERYGALTAPINEILASFAIAGVILYGGLSVINGVRTQGDFIAFCTSMFLLYEPLKRLGRVNNTYQSGLSAGERIFELLDTNPEVAEKEGAFELDRVAQTIAYQGVSFAYKSRSESDGSLALTDINLKVEPGETLALVGMSGGGKSTIVSLLARFYDPQSGKITIGGKDIKCFTLRSLRDSISIVSQHTFLFNDTVANNILYGRLSATRDDVIRVAQAANAHEFIMRLPQEYDTVIGEQGMMLSGGERARIAIARALLKDAPFLILDEATASLDSEAEAAVQDAIDTLMNRRTVFVIAHRLATIRKANQIAVVVAGKIVESGTHEELLSHRGEYAKLYSIQFRESSDDDGSPQRQVGNHIL